MALAKLYRQDKEGHGECRVYRCPKCAGFHLTSRPRGKFKADRR